MALGSSLLIAVLLLAGAVAALAQAAAVIERGGSRASAALFSGGWLLLAFIPVAWGIFGGRTAWYVEAIGAYDFAGAIPFHLGGGVGALAIALLLPDSGRLLGRPRGIFQVTLALLAVAVLWIGWLTLMELDLNRFTPTIVANSVILAGTSVAAAVVVERVVTGRNSAIGAGIGLITGLAAATASCAFLEPVTAGVTGLLAGAVAAGIAFRKRAGDRSLPGDRSLAGAIAITNLVGGITGLLMVGLLESSRGFFYTGSFALPVAQATAVIVCVVYSALVCVPLALMTSRRQAKENS